MEKTLTQELWMRQSTEFTMSDGTTVNGGCGLYVRDLNEGESVEDIDEGEEYMEVVGGSIVPNLVDENYDGIDDMPEPISEASGITATQPMSSSILAWMGSSVQYTIT